MAVAEIDPLDEECARAAARSAGLDPDQVFGETRKAWEIYLNRAKEIRAVYDTLRGHEKRMDAVASEVYAAMSCAI